MSWKDRAADAAAQVVVNTLSHLATTLIDRAFGWEEEEEDDDASDGEESPDERSPAPRPGRR